MSDLDPVGSRRHWLVSVIRDLGFPIVVAVFVLLRLDQSVLELVKAQHVTNLLLARLVNKCGLMVPDEARPQDWGIFDDHESDLGGVAAADEAR